MAHGVHSKITVTLLQRNDAVALCKSNVKHLQNFM